jgi:hypothetical protein
MALWTDGGGERKRSGEAARSNCALPLILQEILINKYVVASIKKVKQWSTFNCAGSGSFLAPHQTTHVSLGRWWLIEVN